MPPDHEQRVSELRDRIEKARQLKYKYEARLDELNRQRERLLLELAELQVRPEDLAGEIERLQQESDALLQEAAALLPADLVK